RNAAKSYQDSWSRSEDPLVGIFRGVAETGARAASGLFDRLGNRGGGSGTGGTGTGSGNSDN
ncbi:MAG TPA: peptidase M48, partial [Trebonia sp.]|nr:peptidase M48 [Trebonia sp.]